MRFPKKLTSMLLVLCLVVSVAAIAIVPAAAEETVETYAMDTVRGGSILHCFDWSYNNIKANLADIAKAGYTAVQTSPVQSPKDYNAGWTDASGQWWKLYQPLGFSVSNGNTWLGTKAELTSLCAEAEKYNIKVIVDIVANHLANNGTDGGTYSYLNSGVDTDLKNANYYHTNNTRTSDNSRYTITQYHLGMPDLNTGNSYVQQRVLGLLEECLDCGVDGFRFDAAKHIELPTDGSSCASQFWPTVINGATAYAAQKGYAAPFYYGEILGGAGTDISNYTTYMAVTDNYTGDLALDKAYWKYAPDLANGTYYKGASAVDSVLWVESHDTYMGESGSAWTKNTKDVTSDVLDKAWAIVGARADSTALFFARPNATMGLASADTNWKSTAVAEVNKFKNHFAGTGEYLASSGNTVAYIERGTKGVVISKLDGGGAVSITAHQMEDGTYTDQVTGNSFTVANGTISGTVGDTGVAVVYNPAESVLDYITADTLYLDPSADGWKQGNERYAMYLFNSAAEGTAWVSMSDSDNDGIYSAGVPSGNWTNVIFCRMDGSATENSWDSKWYQTINLYPEGNYNLFTVTGQQYGQSGNYVGDWSVFEDTQPTTAQPTTVQPTTVQPTTSAPASDTITVYAYNTHNWSEMNVYYWGSSSTNPDWPGVPMENGTTVFSATIPKDVTGIIFNNNTDQTVDIKSGIVDNMQWYITNETDSSGHYSVENGPTYYLVGGMTDWGRDNSYQLSLAPAADGKVQYQLNHVALRANAEIKISDSNNNWYPSNYNGNYTVPADGTYTVYFRPNADGDSDWHYNYFKLESTTSTYTVTWKNDDGTILKTDTVAEGETPAYAGDTPAKAATLDNTYTFSGWTPAPAPAAGDVTYTASYTAAEVPKYNIGLTNAIGWDTVYVYYWLGSQNNNWPGTALTVSGTDNFQMTAQIPSNVEGVIFNNGGDKQTGDITANIKNGAHWAVSLHNNAVAVNEVPSYYLVGTMNNWDKNNAPVFIPVKNDRGLEEYKLSEVVLSKDAQMKVCDSNDHWFPSGSNANYTVGSAGTYDVYFRPHGDGNQDWHQGYFYLANVSKYMVRWVDGDGHLLKTDTVSYGETPQYTGDVPTKTADAQYSYIFNNTWEPSVTAATADATYHAQFDATVNTYRVIWRNYDGSLLATDQVPFGETPAYSGSTPEKPYDEQYHYTFRGWDTPVQPVADHQSYTAVFDIFPHAYVSPSQTDWNLDEHKVEVTYICSDCGHEERHTVYFSDYDFEATTPPTCTQPGTGHYRVTDNFNYNMIPLLSDDIEIPATGHAWLPPVCVWSEDYSSATVTFTCTQCGESVVLTDDSIEVTYNGDNAIYRASVMLDGQAYFFDHSETRQYFTGHTLTLKGDIGVNYFIALTDEEFNTGNVAVQFTYNVEGNIKTFTVSKDAIKKVGENLYKATCYVAAAEMTYDITADLFLNEMLKASNVYSVKEYADYIIAHADDNAAYAKAAPLVLAMLDYGTRAQVVFERNTDKPANGGTYKVTYDVKADDMEVPVSDMKANLDTYGLTYVGSTVIYLSETTLRHYYRVTDEDAFNNYRDSITLDGAPAAFGERNGMVYVEFTNISAKDLGKAHTFTIGDDSYNYSALAYAKKVIEKGTNPDEVELAKAMVRYDQAAETFFGA